MRSEGLEETWVIRDLERRRDSLEGPGVRGGCELISPFVIVLLYARVLDDLELRWSILKHLRFSIRRGKAVSRKPFQTIQQQDSPHREISNVRRSEQRVSRAICSKRSTCMPNWWDVAPEFTRWIVSFLSVGLFWYEIREYFYPIVG